MEEIKIKPLETTLEKVIEKLNKEGAIVIENAITLENVKKVGEALCPILSEICGMIENDVGLDYQTLYELGITRCPFVGHNKWNVHFESLQQNKLHLILSQ